MKNNEQMEEVGMKISDLLEKSGMSTKDMINTLVSILAGICGQNSSPEVACDIVCGALRLATKISVKAYEELEKEYEK